MILSKKKVKRKTTSTSSNDKALNENCPLQYAMGLLNGLCTFANLFYISIVQNNSSHQQAEFRLKYPGNAAALWQQKGVF